MSSLLIPKKCIKARVKLVVGRGKHGECKMDEKVVKENDNG